MIKIYWQPHILRRIIFLKLPEYKNCFCPFPAIVVTVGIHRYISYYAFGWKKKKYLKKHEHGLDNKVAKMIIHKLRNLERGCCSIGSIMPSLFHLFLLFGSVIACIFIFHFQSCKLVTRWLSQIYTHHSQKHNGRRWDTSWSYLFFREGNFLIHALSGHFCISCCPEFWCLVTLSSKKGLESKDPTFSVSMIGIDLCQKGRKMKKNVCC